MFLEFSSFSGHVSLGGMNGIHSLLLGTHSIPDLFFMKRGGGRSMNCHYDDSLHVRPPMPGAPRPGAREAGRGGTAAAVAELGGRGRAEKSWSQMDDSMDDMNTGSWQFFCVLCLGDGMPSVSFWVGGGPVQSQSASQGVSRCPGFDPCERSHISRVKAAPV